MSMEYNVYVGSMLRIKEADIKIKETVKGCPVCKASRDSSFCPDCGSIVQDIEVEKKKEFYIRDFIYECGIDEDKFEVEEECSPGFIYLMPNLGSEGFRLNGECEYGEIPPHLPSDYWENLPEELKKLGMEVEELYGCYGYWH